MCRCDENRVLIDMLISRTDQQGRDIHRHDEAIDTLLTAPWRRALFWLKGWPLDRILDAPPDNRRTRLWKRLGGKI